MNAIGIDYQQTLTVICLREGSGYMARLRNIGDGQRALIPNATYGNELWGSHAWRITGSDALCQGDPAQDGPWLNEPGARIFWCGIYQRLYTYLGRVRPLMRNGYQVVVALHAADYSTAAMGVERLCRAAGLSEAMCIPATDALLCHWLTDRRIDCPPEQVIAVITVGDTATLVSAYHIYQKGDRFPHILASAQPVFHIPVGQSAWLARVLEHVHIQFNEPIPPGYELVLRDAAITFAAHLCRADAHHPVEWTGPLAERMYAPLRLARHDCASWPEVTALTASLPAAIQRTVASVSDRTVPDCILVGGVGATWPFVADAARAVAPIWQSGIPQEDVARGAAWWPEMCQYFSEAGYAVKDLAVWSERQPPVNDWLGERAEENSSLSHQTLLLWQQEQPAIARQRDDVAVHESEPGQRTAFAEHTNDSAPDSLPGTAIAGTEHRKDWPEILPLPDDWSTGQILIGTTVSTWHQAGSAPDRPEDEQHIEGIGHKAEEIARWPVRSPDDTPDAAAGDWIMLSQEEDVNTFPDYTGEQEEAFSPPGDQAVPDDKAAAECTDTDGCELQAEALPPWKRRSWSDI